MKSNLLLLADVFENFRKIRKDYYISDCAHYISTPSLTFDSLLKMMELKFNLLSDIDQHLFIEQGLRGELSVIIHRKSEALNKYITDYNKDKETKFITYLDSNHLYGWAMSESHPYGGIKWLNNLENFDIQKVTNDSDFCHILEVDIEYPKELHDLHKDYLFCAQQ